MKFPDVDHCTLVIYENVLVLRKNILNYLEVMEHNVSNLLSNSSIRREKETLGESEYSKSSLNVTDSATVSEMMYDETNFTTD